MNKNDKQTNGITLVALIITIIIMLILAGVSISIAINGGLFYITKKVAKETENARNIEQQLSNGKVKINEIWYDTIKDYINEKPSENQEGGENPPVADTSIYENAPKDETTGLLLSNAKYTVDGKTAVIPKGFKIVNGIEEMKSINAGLVVQDKEGNEFVWIPVEVTEDDTETKIKSFYRSEWMDDNKRGASLTESTEYIEPYTSGYTEEVAEYNAMLKSVYTNKGFYIGRYEAGKADGKMVVKKNQSPYVYVDWGTSMTEIGTTGAVYLSKNMYNGQDVGVTSTLVYGVQWDTMLDFIKDNNHNVINSSSWGNFSDSIAETRIE